MSTPADEPTPDLDHYYDDSPDTPGAVLCRVCGSLVGHRDDYRRVHWDWHEATNGA